MGFVVNICSVGKHDTSSDTIKGLHTKPGGICFVSYCNMNQFLPDTAVTLLTFRNIKSAEEVIALLKAGISQNQSPVLSQSGRFGDWIFPFSDKDTDFLFTHERSLVKDALRIIMNRLFL